MNTGAALVPWYANFLKKLKKLFDPVYLTRGEKFYTYAVPPFFTAFFKKQQKMNTFRELNESSLIGQMLNGHYADKPTEIRSACQLRRAIHYAKTLVSTIHQLSEVLNITDLSSSPFLCDKGLNFL